MKLPFKSIRWRLQAWHGVLLLLVLLAFGLQSFYLARENRFGLINRELLRQSILVSVAMPESPQRNAIFKAVDLAIARQSNLASEEMPDSPRRDAIRGIMQKTILERLQSDFHLSSESSESTTMTNTTTATRQAAWAAATMLASSEQAGFYYVLWQPDGAVLLCSGNSPGNIPKPEPDNLSSFQMRTRGSFREQFITATNGVQLLVGCPITADLASLHHLALRMASVGCVVMLFGLAGGWWLATRAIHPIKEISATASEIAGGKLTKRINLSDTDSELGQLAGVLNASFDELQAAFDRQVQFTADASHELRTPVSVVLAETNSALSRERTPAEYQEGFESCRRAARRMRLLTDSLIKLARLDSGEHASKRERCNLQAVVLEVIELLRPLADERGVKLHADLDEGPCIGDAEQLGQVVMNLVNNAIQYNQTNGEVRVKVGSSGRITVLNVIDTGQGIAAEDLPHIFDRFYRADKSHSSAADHVGLGLAITKAIVEAHGGTINVLSEPGFGSTFTVGFKRPEDTSSCNAERRNGATFKQP